jgi:hypothetical protein
MKAIPNLDFAVVKPDNMSLKRFVGMIRKIYQNLTFVINGNLGFGDGTNPDNVSGNWINTTCPVTPNTDFTVNHNLNRLPVGYWIMQKDRAVDIYTGSVAATNTQITLRATVASAVVRLFVVCILFALGANAQTTNITLQVTDAGGQSWNNGTWTVVLSSPPGVSPYGPPFFILGTSNPVPNQTQSGVLSGTGSGTMTLTQNSGIAPALSQWKYTVCPQANTNQCFTQSVTITAVTTVTLTPPAISVQAGLTTTAYSSSEVVGFIGQQYYDLTLGQTQICTSPAFGQCVTWSPTGGISNVSSLPALCTPGVTPPVNLTTPPYGIYFCSATNTWTLGGSLTPAGNNGDLQMKSGSALAASHINDNGALLNLGEDAKFNGPNPYVDIRTFGVRVVNPNVTPAIPGCTATINLGTPTIATLSSACGFVNGDSVVIIGAGSANGMSTPAAPTVTPSLAAAMTNTGFVVNAPAGGANTKCYKIAARDQGQGLTVASPETCTTGQTLGTQTLNLLTEQLGATNVVTATTAARSPEVLASGMEIRVTGTTNDTLFGGRYIVNTVPNNTSFTYQTPSDARAGASTAAGSGGQIVYWYSNHVVMPTPSSPVWQYYLYAGASGAETLLIPSKEITNTNLQTDPSYMTLDDYGSPYTTAPILPYFVPTTPPASATADSLVTTIVSGGGTTTLTLANPASTAVTNQTILLDSTAGTINAFAAQASTRGMIYYPAGCCIVYNSILNTIPYGGVGVSVAGQLFLNDSLVSQNMWHADLTPTNLTLPQFGLSALQTITINRANPGIIETTGNWYGFNFQISGNVGNNYSAVYINGGSIPTAQFENVAFSGSGGGDFSGIMYTQFTSATAGSNAAGVNFRNLTLNASATGETPAFVSKNFGETYIDGYVGSGRAFFASNLGTIGGFTINGKYETQGPSTPLFTARGALGLNLTGLTEDTGTQPIVTLLSGGIFLVLGSNIPSGGIPRVSGLPPASSSIGFLPNANSTNGLLNTNGFYATLVNDGTFNGTTQTIQVDQNHRMLGTGYSFFTSPPTAQPPAAVCSLVSAGPPFTAAGTYNFTYFPIYFNGGWGIQSAVSNNCTPNGTSQQVQITISAIPGATQYVWYYNGNNIFPINGVACNHTTSLLTFNLENVGSCGFNSLPSVPGGGPAGVTGNSVWGISGQFGTEISTGVPNVTGCSITNSIGGNSAGSFQSGTTGTCTVTITPGITAPNGFACGAKDLTTPADEPKQTGYTTTTATLSWTTVSGDLITWSCKGF